MTDIANNIAPAPKWQQYTGARKKMLSSAVSFCSPSGGRGLMGPDFICIGAAKTGTSWLYDILKSHPLIWLPPIKEISYFTSHYVVGSKEYFRPRRLEQLNEARRYWSDPDGGPIWRPLWDREGRIGAEAAIEHLAKDELTDDWYQEIFGFRDPDQVAGDISPDYALLPRAGVRHLVSLNPHIRIIVLLRDPVERLISHAAMTMKGTKTVGDLRELIRSRRAENWKTVSNYGYWLPRWLSAIDSNRLHIEYNGRITADPLGVLGDLCRFLGVPFDPDIFPNAHRRVYEGQKPDGYEQMIEEIREECSVLYDNLNALPEGIRENLAKWG